MWLVLADGRTMRRRLYLLLRRQVLRCHIHLGHLARFLLQHVLCQLRARFSGVHTKLVDEHLRKRAVRCWYCFRLEPIAGSRSHASTCANARSEPDAADTEPDDTSTDAHATVPAGSDAVGKLLKLV